MQSELLFTRVQCCLGNVAALAPVKLVHQHISANFVYLWSDSGLSRLYLLFVRFAPTYRSTDTDTSTDTDAEGHRAVTLGTANTMHHFHHVGSHTRTCVYDVAAAIHSWPAWAHLQLQQYS
jgi:hypothetical protein